MTTLVNKLNYYSLDEAKLSNDLISMVLQLFFSVLQVMLDEHRMN